MTNGNIEISRLPGAASEGEQSLSLNGDSPGVSVLKSALLTGRLTRAKLCAPSVKSQNPMLTIDSIAN